MLYCLHLIGRGCIFEEYTLLKRAWKGERAEIVKRRLGIGRTGISLSPRIKNAGESYISFGRISIARGWYVHPRALLLPDGMKDPTKSVLYGEKNSFADMVGSREELLQKRCGQRESREAEKQSESYKAEKQSVGLPVFVHQPAIAIDCPHDS